MDRSDYIEAINQEHLSATVTLQDGSTQNVYRKIDPVMILAHHGKIKDFIEDSVVDKIIKKELGDQLVPEHPAEGRAYGMPKTHKPLGEGKNLPPMRLVVSGCRSNTENISHFVNHHTSHIPEMMDSFIQDTPHLLRMLQDINSTTTLPADTFLVSIDVVGLYPNIPQNEGIAAFKKVIGDSKFRDQKLSTSFLMTLLEHVLTLNTFIFNGEYFVQEWGTSIGTKVAPVYANIFMADLEKNMLKKFKGRLPSFWRRYIDDIFTIFRGREKDLLKFLEHICSFHPTIKFTCEYRTGSEIVKCKWKDNKLEVTRIALNDTKPRSIDFLDATVWINNEGKLETDLFSKDTDKITYLKPQSCHPAHICRNIPYSLGYRLLRLCSARETFYLRLKELRANLRSRGYSDKIISKAFDRLEPIKRDDALKKVVKNKNNDRVMLSITYDPRVADMSSSIKKHYNFAKRDPNFVKVFPEIPMIGFKRARNLGEHLIRAKLYPVEKYNFRDRLGFSKCSKKDIGCSLCSKRENTSKHVSSFSKKVYPIKSKISCKDTYVIYSIECKKCNLQYVGQTIQPVYKRFLNHFYDVLNKNIEKPVPAHFVNSRDHSIHDMIFTPFEKLYKKDKTLLDVREKFWIVEKKTFSNGLNKML